MGGPGGGRQEGKRLGGRRLGGRLGIEQLLPGVGKRRLVLLFGGRFGSIQVLLGKTH